MSSTTLLTEPPFSLESTGETEREPPVETAPSEARIVKANEIDRRQFLTAAGGLLLGFTLAGGSQRAAQAASVTTNVNGWIGVGTDETITIFIGGSEMGQGAYSGLAQIAAEELKVDWAKVKAVPAPAAQSWVTGGSSNIRRHFQTMQMAGATAREMLIAAAASTWKVSPAVCKASQGTVINTLTNASLTYGKLAALAATLPVPANPPLTPSSQFKLIGTAVPRPDLPAKTNGSAQYGIDAHVPGMLYAVIQHAPALGGTLQGTPPVPPGALGVVPLGNAVAVVASNTWQAMQAAQELQANWSIPKTAQSVDSALILTQAQTLMTGNSAIVAEQAGDVAGGLAKSARVLDMTYNLPYLAHACMEVLNCTVRLSSNLCEIWVPTQAPNLVASVAAGLTGLKPNQIQVTPLLMGGGLGRKFELDYVTQAIQVAKAVGKPVKLTWPRSEDMQNDQYRPMALTRIRVGLDGSGNILAWANRIVSPSILGQRGWIPPTVNDSQATEGATDLTYGFGSRLVEYVPHPAPVPVGFWRSVGNSINAFAVESAIDEVALATNTDPLALRQRLLANDPRGLAVLNAAAQLGGWGTSLPTGHARGIAMCASFGSIVAEVVEISHPNPTTIKVHKVACAIDCGNAINPNSVEAQMQSGIYHGLSAALWGQVTFKAGKANVRNFSNYRVLRMSEAPVISVQIIQSGAPLGGVGEPGVPPIAPAVANAYARLTGTRVRTLPFFPGATMSGD